MSTPAEPIDTNALLDIAAGLVKRATRLGAEAAEASVVQSRSTEVAVRDGHLEAVEGSESRDAGLRVFFGKRQAGVSFSDLSEDGMSQAVERAIAMAKAAPEDKWAGLVDEARLATEFPDIALYEHPSWSSEEMADIARGVEAAARSVEGVSMTETAFASNGETASASVATNGVSHTARRSSHGYGVSVIAARDGVMERDYSMTSARRLADLRAHDEIGVEAGQRTIARLGAKQMASGIRPVLFDRRVSARFLGALEGAIAGPAIARGVSFLRDKLGEQVFGEHINVIDDPHRDWGLGSRPVDGEGVANAKQHIIENGVLTTWLLNSPSARQLGLDVNGYATRSLGGSPGVSTTNLHVEPGSRSREAIIADIQDGLLITEMFSPSLNANTGDWSVGCSGFAIRSGTIAEPVSEITVAGNLLDIFKRLEPADDLKFWSSVNSPSLLVDGLSIGGA
ncbi:TldD/PmbA family protein [Hyphobacterium sp. HN65]|uniref:TldD/PmbA family protein n=1 Tax=Hyphobacterium lacteum TaxID=3116575 RepID=A0ABU7LPS6_9PROT|nr:TldD/PmbA family protein [Hyphobacterium sp. HN65]MEE2525344.1 TldD/PmbA family protein [Hyphobacterium sp. HN65]